MFSLPQELISILACPACTRSNRANNKANSGLDLYKSKSKNHYLRCSSCNALYPVKATIYTNYTDGKHQKIQIKTPFLFQNQAINAEINSAAKSLKSLKRAKPERDSSNLVLKKSQPEYSLSATIVYNKVLSMIKSNNRIIIDNGCGDHGFKKLANKKNIFGIEKRVCTDAFYPIQLFADSEQLPFKSNSIPLFISNFVIHHTENQKSYISEIYRTLKKQGTAIISFPTPYWYIAHFISLSTYKSYIISIIKSPKEFIKNPVSHFLHQNAHGSKKNTFTKEIMLFNEKRYEQLFKEAGFKIVEKITTGNILSLYLRYTKIASLFKNENIKHGIHNTYILEK